MTTDQHQSSPRTGAGRIAAVVLAAGFSSRMGTLKPLLPLGSSTTIERVVSSLRAAGVARLVVVTGHEAEAVAPVLERLGVERAHNAGYVSGMFSSVRAGVAALPEDIDTFFVLPVDCPLVTPRVLRLLAEHFRCDGAGIIYPTCFGRRGHPPLLSACYIRPLLEADETPNLQAFLASHAADEAEVDVRDLTVLMDMDTPDDYRVLSTFAAALDSAAPLDAAAATRPELPLTADEALFLLAAAGTPANIVRHCRAAAAVGENVARALKPHLPGLDVALVRAGCLLHDIARVLPHHALLAQEVLTNLGLPRLGAVVGEHMVINPGRPGAPGVTEAELVYLADKLVADGELVGLDERQARALRKMGPGPEAAQRIADRINDARTISTKVGALLGRPVEEAVSGAGIPDHARPQKLRVYLVRHAEPEGPGGRRYVGRADPPLSRQGEEQARLLAGRLMAMTGGACFDAVFSSDLQRCLRTAEIATEACGTPVQALPWLREIDVGLWEGLTWEEARQRYPAESDEREQDVTGVPFPEGESFTDVRARVVPHFERLVEESMAAGHRRVLVVAHKGVNRVLLAHFRDLPLEDIFSIEQDYCAVNVLTAPPRRSRRHPR
jgi:broad specificity phosphatase PhoE/CTP:molybdopterin cytidylyltransferase MocA